MNEDTAYWERIDRNIGWITREEQERLRACVVGIAGCGGMGGLLAAILVRLGVGEVRIADSDRFDMSNLNRQFSARRSTVGKPKAAETARDLRELAEDVRISVFPDGITRDSVAAFCRGCDIICDEIEFWASGSRIVLHQEARARGLPLCTCTSVGFGTRLFYFDRDSLAIEEMLGMTCEDALALEQKIRTGEASENEIEQMLWASMGAIVPELPRYTACGSGYDDREACVRRLRAEQKASIIACNPPLAAGFLADRLTLLLLAGSGIERPVAPVPRAPGYLYLDAAHMVAKCVHSGDTHGC